MDIQSSAQAAPAVASASRAPDGGQASAGKPVTRSASGPVAATGAPDAGTSSGFAAALGAAVAQGQVGAGSDGAAQGAAQSAAAVALDAATAADASGNLAVPGGAINAAAVAAAETDEAGEPISGNRASKATKESAAEAGLREPGAGDPAPDASAGTAVPAIPMAGTAIPDAIPAAVDPFVAAPSDTGWPPASPSDAAREPRGEQAIPPFEASAARQTDRVQAAGGVLHGRLASEAPASQAAGAGMADPTKTGAPPTGADMTGATMTGPSMAIATPKGASLMDQAGTPGPQGAAPASGGPAAVDTPASPPGEIIGARPGDVAMALPQAGKMHAEALQAASGKLAAKPFAASASDAASEGLVPPVPGTDTPATAGSASANQPARPSAGIGSQAALATGPDGSPISQAPSSDNPSKAPAPQVTLASSVTSSIDTSENQPQPADTQIAADSLADTKANSASADDAKPPVELPGASTQAAAADGDAIGFEAILPAAKTHNDAQATRPETASGPESPLATVPPLAANAPAPDAASRPLPAGWRGTSALPVAWPARQLEPFAVALALGPDASLTLTLTPADLGRVQVSIERSGSAAAIRVMAERPETLALLQRDSRDLERALADAGFGARAPSLSFSLGLTDGAAGTGSNASGFPGANQQGGDAAGQSGGARRDADSHGSGRRGSAPDGSLNPTPVAARRSAHRGLIDLAV